MQPVSCSEPADSPPVTCGNCDSRRSTHRGRGVRRWTKGGGARLVLTRGKLWGGTCLQCSGYPEHEGEFSDSLAAAGARAGA